MQQSKKERLDTVTRSEQFAATIKKSADHVGNILIITSRAFYQNQLNKFRDGEKVTMVIHSRKPKRTEQQNRYYWGAYIPLIAAETGERDYDALHELFKGKFLTKGIKEVLGEKVRIKGSTTDLDIAEFSAFIMAIEEFTGIQSPPVENYDLISLKEGIKHVDS